MKMQKKIPFKIFHHYHALSSYHIIHHKNQWKSFKKKKSFKKRKFEKIQSLQCFAQVSPMLSVHVIFANTWKSSSGSPFGQWPSPMEWSLFSLSHQGPLWWNGHWLSYVYIKVLSDGMVIDFLMFTSRPSLMEWALIFLCLHQGPLQWNGHWFFLCLHQGPLQWNGHWFSFLQDPLQWNDQWFLSSLLDKTFFYEWLIQFLLSRSWPSS